MKTRRLVQAVTLLVVGMWTLPLLFLGLATTAQGQAATESDVQVLTRGPIHEAFAEASMTGASAGVVITKAPPNHIAELPPDQRPEGANVAWIPGYWNWDDDRTDFIWVSGVWRDIPPSRQWVPGYWTPVNGGSQWISGFWGDAAQTQVTYLPAPPEPLEVGPSSPTPGPDNIWAPGSWVWQQTRYDWQPGYWVVQRPDWVWTPARYSWTPRGYVYVPGYWDHDIIHRGVMFAPVYYGRPVYTRPDYSYSPSIVIDLGAVLACLFVQPRSHHYYYGDYYDHRYEERGFYPWYSRQHTRYGDDPIYTHYRSRQLQQDPEWDTHIDEQFRHRREHVDARPPQTLALQLNLINTRQANAPENVIIGRSLAEAVERKSLPQRFTSVNMEERKQIETRGREVRNFELERAKVETQGKAVGKSMWGLKSAKPVSVQLPTSPVAAKAVGNVEGATTPPPLPVAPPPQVVKGKGRQVKSQKIEGTPEAPASQETVKSRVRARPEKIEVQPSPVIEAPRRIEVQPETRKPEPAPQTLTPRSEPTKREIAPVKTKVKSSAPEDVTTPKSQRVKARPEPKTKAPEARGETQTVEPKQKLRKSETEKTEPQTQPHKTKIKKQKGKQEQEPNTEDNKKGGRNDEK